ncbi:hypothetical protein [Actinopolymorpha alba]|uniref:hypothetical protein n=1 Tax=Actinopolymorpha alba TaxID=533267 RepID=UPI00035CAF85|nr:hypothetical protein [Actinopolymorpha alba]
MEEPVERFRLVGYVRIDPPLRRAEFEYLTAFAESRRWRRPGGPYAVPDNPIAECLDPKLDLSEYSLPAEGQPGLHCPWTPGHGGRALVPSHDLAGGNGIPPAESASWLSYLRDHFLARAARVNSLSGAPAEWFTGFSFDHVLDGAAAVCSDQAGELTAIRVVSSAVSTEVLWRG